MSANETLDAALSYAAHGLRVVPIRPRGKAPSILNWVELATTDADTIRRWFSASSSGVGIVCGAASGLFVLDVDVADGKPGLDSLRALEAKYGALPSTVEVVTGSGGLHLYFRWPAGATIATSASRLGPGLDVRAEGGQVLAPPTLHPNGKRYAWAQGHEFELHEIAEAPQWLIELLRPEMPQLVVERSTHSDDDDSPAAWFNETTTWQQLLSADGWTLARSFGVEQQWTRPGKSPRDGISATVNHEGRDVLKCFTSSVAGLEADRAYNRFGYYAATKHNGDRSAAAGAIRQRMPRQVELVDVLGLMPAASERTAGDASTSDDEDAGDLAFAHLVDFVELWNEDLDADERWLVWPIVPAQRAVALYAPAKAGKSYLALYLIAAALTHKRRLDDVEQPDDFAVLYLDYEMTKHDLLARLEEFGYGPDDDLSRLHYALLPSIDPLDTAEGAARLLSWVEQTNVQLVVVDTFGRAVAGEENRADTTRDFYRHTGLALKRRNVAVVRIDHAGKDIDKGQRGSSAKQDDVDVVWRLSQSDRGLRLARTHSRISWVPEHVELERIEDRDGFVTFRKLGANVQTWPAGTQALAVLLDELDAALDITRNDARALLKRSTGRGASTARIQAAISFRRQSSVSELLPSVDIPAGDTSQDTSQNGLRGHAEDTSRTEP